MEINKQPKSRHISDQQVQQQYTAMLDSVAVIRQIDSMLIKEDITNETHTSLMHRRSQQVDHLRYMLAKGNWGQFDTTTIVPVV